MKKLLIVNVGSAPESQLNKFGDFELWAKQAIGSTTLEIEFHDGIANPLPKPQVLAGVIIMGSLSMVTEETNWMKRLAAEIVQLAEHRIPTLGICFGHQLISYAFGGDIDFNPNGLEVGTVNISRLENSDDDPLLSQLPEHFHAQAVHFQSVLTLPKQAVRLAQSNMDQHHAFRAGDCTWGVQFHPEFTTDIMLDVLENFQEELGEDVVNRKIQQVVPADEAQRVLVNFARLCEERKD
ncbi:glutamine amidotransferase [Vibrio tubiashii]|uniref:Glutamine amidotransferase n=1 Tax=Vibrio tubiashii ATCC 19109 TaxID=1051646 RepID=F9TAS5_9VIBR|nr:glutamine amidotransferase [Vibrio tubiashii]AIW16988.1 glutamine amidotransferase [Vibrio tubiashii ATCC 19109]EGU49799.1 glutamine amidotransferase class-I [Vibrio tubiashii ATCC 19109]EIF04733.1 glutamine amidotransferase [Vibrio tubiashii NCIMB 1337 = ATCC 19106]